MTSPTAQLKTTRVNHTLWVAIDHPPANFLTIDLCEQLHRILQAAERDDSIRVIVLTGGITDRYIFHFSIPELLQICGANRRLLLDRICNTRIGNRLLEYQAAFGLWLMGKSSLAERTLLALLLGGIARL